MNKNEKWAAKIIKRWDKTVKSCWAVFNEILADLQNVEHNCLDVGCGEDTELAEDLKFKNKFGTDLIFPKNTPEYPIPFLQSDLYDTPEEVLPGDIEENEQYIELPSSAELELGKTLVLDFVSEYLPSEINNVYTIFSSKGAYSRYKSLLESHGVIDKWYEYEQSAQKKALIKWCSENGIEIDI